MANILNIETATKNCSVSLSTNGETISIRELATEGYSHAELLHVYIDEVIKESGIEMAALDAIAVSKGPGSYTGLRIGVSAAKGLCYALNIPLISVDTLLLLAKKVTIQDGIIVPMLDARRMEVYMAGFDKNFDKVMPIAAEIITEESFNEIDETIYIVGDCQEKCKPVLTNKKFSFLEDIVHPSANEMSAISFDKYLAKDFEDVAYFEPFYLKNFVLNK